MSRRYAKDRNQPRDLPWWKRLRDRLELPFARFGFWLVPRLPRWAIRALARVAGGLAYAFSRRNRDLALANLDVAFGNRMPEREKRRVARASLANFARTTLDLLWFNHPRKAAARLEKYVRWDAGAEASLARDNARVAVTGHFGNWELVGRLWAERSGGLASVSMPLKNPQVEVLLEAVRQRTAQAMVPREGALRHLVRVLRGGGQVGLLLDQNTAPWEGGVYRPFFGLTASMSPVAGMLCRLADADLVFGYALPLPGGAYEIRIPHRRTAVQLRAEAAPDALPDHVNDLLLRWYEEAIAAHPEAWLWAYKRWRYIPLGADPSPFPWYALPPEGDPWLAPEWQKFLHAKRKRPPC